MFGGLGKFLDFYFVLSSICTIFAALIPFGVRFYYEH